MKKQLYFLFLSVFFIWQSVNSQTFPVTLIPQATPPAPIYFSSYADASSINSPLRLQIVLNDLSQINREIRLKTYFEGNGLAFQSKDVIIGAPALFIEGGVPLTLTNAQLAPYFAFENITGISPVAYGQAIPEGSYQFCFEVFDVLTGARISQRTCAASYVFQNEPPLVITPANKSNITEQNPLNLMFQWTPRHINVSNVQYELSIVEIWDNQMDPQAAFLSSPSFFQTTTTNTSYLYGPADPLFLPNKRYAWRVQAKAINGAEEIGLFKNNGFSEIYWFNYIAPCYAPDNVRHEIKGAQQVNILWDDFTTEVPEFTVRYREKGNNNEWFISKTNGNWLTLWDLRAGATYEYQVNKKCLIADSDYSKTQTFTTLINDTEEGLVDCGISPDLNIENMEPLEQLFPGNTFKAGDFPVKVTEVSGSSGRFTGKGYVTFPYFKNIKVAVNFTNIFVNDQNQLAEGMVMTVYDPNWGNVLDVDEVIDIVEDIADVFTGGDKEIIKLDYPIEEGGITVTDEQIVITKPDGTKDERDYDEGDTYTITDSTGNSWTVDKDGNVSQTNQGDPSPPLTAENSDGIRSGNHSGTIEDPYVDQVTTEGIKVTFKTGDDTRFALDLANNEYEKATYPKINTSGNDEYYPAHKAVVQGESDIFYVDIEITDAKINIDSLIIKTVDNKAITHERLAGQNTYKITIQGLNPYRTEECVITYLDTEDNKYKIAASFFIHHLINHKEVPVQVVTVNGGNNITGLQKGLNDIFGLAGGKFKVKEKVINLEITQSSWDDNKNKVIDYDGSSLTSDYPKELKNIYKEFKKQYPKYDSQQYFIFVLSNEFSVTKPLSGFMPKTRQWGFLFEKHLSGEGSSKNSALNIAAHELGHGVFALRHPFGENTDNAGKASTWLMDYGSGIELGYPNWATMGGEGIKLLLFENDQGGELGGQYWLTPNWQAFKVENSRTIYTGNVHTKHVQGTIPGFKLNKGTPNEITYYANYDANGKFLNYKSDKAGIYNLTVASLQNKDDIYVFRNNGGCKQDTYYKTTWEFIKNKKENIPFSDKENLKDKKIVPCNDSNSNDNTKCSNFKYLDEENPDHEDLIAKYQKAADESLSKALTSIGGTKGTLFRSKGTYNHVQFANTNDKPLNNGQIELIEDKLHLLSHYKPDTYTVVTFLKIENNLSYLNGQVNDLAKKSITNNTSNISGKKVVHIIVPYSDYESIFGVGFANDNTCYNIGYAESEQGILASTNALSSRETLFKDILKVYKEIKKPIYIKQFFLKADGGMYETMRKAENVSGFDAIHIIHFFKSTYIQKIKDARRNVPHIGAIEPSQEEIDDYKERYRIYKKEINDLYSIAEFHEIDIDVHNNKSTWEYYEPSNINKLRDVYMLDPGVSRAYFVSQTGSFGFGEKFKIYAGFNETLNNELHFYDFDGYSVIDPIVYGIADGLSLIPIPYVDNIGDGLGFLYATYRGDVSQAPFFAIGLAIPIGAGYLKMGRKGVDDMFAVVARKADNGEIVFEAKKFKDIKTGEIQVTPTLSDKASDAQKALKGAENNKDKIAKYFDNVAGIGDDIIKNTTKELKALRLKINPEGSRFNCVGCAIEFQRKVSLEANDIVATVSNVPSEKVEILIKDVFGWDYVKKHKTAFIGDQLFNQVLGKIKNQESVILLGKFKTPKNTGVTHHAFNAVKDGNGVWKVIDVQNGTSYSAGFIFKEFVSVDTFEILYKNVKDGLLVVLKGKVNLPNELYAWINGASETLLKKLNELPKNSIDNFVSDFGGNSSILTKFDEDPELLNVWLNMEKKGMSPKLRKNPDVLEKSKQIDCK